MNKSALAIAATLSGLMVFGVSTPLWLVATSPIWGFIVVSVTEAAWDQAQRVLSTSK